MMLGWARERTGFTIVELLIVIVVIAILAAIIVVAYTGIRDRAQQSANLEVLDQVERGLRMYQSENGSFPTSAMTSQEIIDQANAVTAQYQQLDQAIANYKQGIATNSPVIIDYDMPNCLPGNYPAVGIFRAGECIAQMSTSTFNSPHLEIRQRIAYTTSKNVAPSIAPKYLSSLPLLSGDTMSYVQTVNNVTASISSQDGSNTITGQASITVTVAYRGAMYLAGLFGPSGTPAAYLIYYAQGNQTCGRGAKQTLTMNDLRTQLEQQLADSGIDASAMTFTMPGSTTWTGCTLMIQ